MLPRTSRPLSAVRAFILAPPTCSASVPSAVASGWTVPSHCSSKCFRPHAVARFSAAAEAQQKPVPYALTVAARTFQEQVQRKELDFLPQAYDHLRQVVLEAQRRGLLLANIDSPMISEDIVKHAMSLLAASSQREHALLHLAIFDDLLPVLHISAEVAHPLEFTAQMFQERVQSGALNELPQVYDHLQHLADAVPDPRQVFTAESAARRAVSWMQRLTGKTTADLLPRIMHDLSRLFGVQSTLVHHQLVIKGFLDLDMPDEAWDWLRNMEQTQESSEKHAVWVKPSTAEYDLLLKYFAKRGDVVSARMLIAHMSAHVTPSQLSYHILLAAILAAPVPVQNQRKRVVAVVEELESAGYSVHLRTLSDIAGRDLLSSWTTGEVFDVLRAAQARGTRNTDNEPAEEESDSMDTDQRDGGSDADVELSSQKVSDIPTDVDATSESQESQSLQNVNSTLMVSEVVEVLHPPAVPTTQVSVPSQDTKLDKNCPTTTGASDGARQQETAEDASSLYTAEHAKDKGQQSRLWHILDSVRRRISTPMDLPTTSSGLSVDVSHVRDDIVSKEKLDPPSEAPSEETSLSERLRQKRIAQPPQDPLAIPTNPSKGSEFPPSYRMHTRNRGSLDRANCGQKIDTVSSDMTSPPQSTPRSDQQTSHLPTSSKEISGESLKISNESMEASSEPLQASGSSVPSKESRVTRSATGGSVPRVLRRHIQLFYRALRAGDLRDASKIYAELTAVTGPDLELGSSMIETLCKGHLLKPPPRPHITQALRIYRSLIEKGERAVAVEGYFDGANRQPPEHMKINAHMYKILLRAVSTPAPADASSRDFGPEIYQEYATYATELVTDMEARGLRPDNRSLVSILLLRFRAAKTHQEAFEYYKSLVANDTGTSESASSHNQDSGTPSDSQPVLDLTAYKAILNAFARISFPSAVAPAHLWFSIVDDMRARGYPVTVEDYTKFLARIPDTQTTSAGKQPPSDVAAQNDWENRLRSMYGSVQYVHKKLVLDPNISPDAHLLNTLMNVYQRLGAFEDALRVFNLIWLSGQMDSVTPIIIFDACGHAGQQNIAYTIWCMLVSKGWRFNKRTLDTWVECLCRTSVETACRFVCVYMGRENAGYLSEGDTRPDVQTCLILLKLSWVRGQNADVKQRIEAHLPHIWNKLPAHYR